MEVDRGDARLERLAINVPDLARQISLFEQLLGPGFPAFDWQQRTGATEIAVHPSGVERAAGEAGVAPSLRSFHLATGDLNRAGAVARELGQRRVDGLVLGGRQHEVFDADSLGLLLVEATGTDDGLQGDAP